jgi:hypothetical protein
LSAQDPILLLPTLLHHPPPPFFVTFTMSSHVILSRLEQLLRVRPVSKRRFPSAACLIT